MIIIYNENSMNQFFFSPYLQIVKDEGVLHFYQTVYHTTFSLRADQDWGEGFCRLLEAGTTRRELTDYLCTMYSSQQDADKVFEMLCGGGIIE